MVIFLVSGKLTLMAASLTLLLTTVMMLKDGVILDDYLIQRFERAQAVFYVLDQKHIL